MGIFTKKQVVKRRMISVARPASRSIVRSYHPLMKHRPTKRSTTSSPDQWLIDWVRGGEPSSSGVSVTEEKAMKYSPFWAAVRIISGTMGMLPFLVYQRDGDDKTRVTNHPAYELLHNRANPYVDSLTFRETLQAHALTYGNGYAEIQRDGTGKPIALWPLTPDRTWRRIDDSGVPFYEIRLPAGESVLLSDDNVLHIKGLGFDGYTGYNVVQYQREAIGYGIAVKEYGGRFFQGDATPGGVLEHPENLSEGALANLYRSWESRHEGLSGSQRLQILEEGMHYTPIGVSPEQAQSLEVQKYTVDDCARIFNIPPHKIASLEHATFSNIEEQNIDFISTTMMYWFKKWEAECNYKLLMPSERKTMFCEILAEGLLRGKFQQRMQGYATGRQWGWWSVNDIRRKENMNTIGDEGDIYLEPLNMKPAGTEDPGTEPVEPEPRNKDDADRAYIKLISDVFERVVTKYQKTGHKKDSHKWAYDRLLASVEVVGELRRVDKQKTAKVLNDMLAIFIKDDVTLEHRHSKHFAANILFELGGNNHAE